MDLLIISLAANAGLVALLLVLYYRAKKRIIEEKLATFSGCLGAITSGLATEDVEQRINRIGLGLSSLCNNDDNATEEIQFYLKRASLLRMFRAATLADAGEHLRMLALQIASDDDTHGDEILLYISNPPEGAAEPSDKWGEDLVAANFVAERQIFKRYASAIAGRPLKVF